MGLDHTAAYSEPHPLPPHRIALMPGVGLGDSLLFLPTLYQLLMGGHSILLFSSPLRSLLEGVKQREQLKIVDTFDFSREIAERSAGGSAGENEGELHELRSCQEIFIQCDSPATRLQKLDLPVHIVGKRRFESKVQALQIQSDIESQLLPCDKIATAALDREALCDWIGLKPSSPDRSPPLVAIHPTSNHAAKNWPLEKFKRVAHCLQQEGFRVVFCLGQQERETADLIGPNYEIWRGLDLRELSNRLLHSRLFIGGDSGLGHLACLLGLPTLSIFQSPRHSRLWRPGWGGNQVILPALPLPGFLRKQLWKACISHKRVVQPALRVLR